MPRLNFHPLSIRRVFTISTIALAATATFPIFLASARVIGPCARNDEYGQNLARQENDSGMKSYKEHKFTWALENFKKASELDCDYWVARMNLASVSALLLRFDDSLEVLENSYNLSPQQTLHKISGDPDYKILLKSPTFWNSRIGKTYAQNVNRPAITERQFILNLIPYLQDQDKTIRASAAKNLGRIGSAARDALPNLIHALGDPESSVRHSAADALGEIGPEAKKAVPHLTLALKDGNEHVRSCAARALGKIGPAAQEASNVLTKDIQDKNSAFRYEAVRLSGEMGDIAASNVSYLIEIAKNPDDPLCGEAIHAIGKIGPKAYTATPVLIRALGDDSVWWKSHDGSITIAEESSQALSRMGVIVTPTLIETLESGGANIRPKAAYLLGTITPFTEEAAKAIAQALKDSRVEVRREVARGLKESGRTLAYTRHELKTGKEETRREMAGLLAQAEIGSRKEMIVTTLVQAVNDTDSSVHSIVTEALGFLEPTKALPELIKALKNDDPKVRSWAAWTIRNLGPDAKDAIPILIDVLADTRKVSADHEMGDEYRVGEAATQALSAIGAAAVPSLILALRNGDPIVRANAASALGFMSPRHGDRHSTPDIQQALNEAVPTLQDVVRNDKDPNIRLRAGEALRTIQE